MLTPNAAEASVLTGIDVDTTADAQRAAEALVEDGVTAVLVTGGHVAGDEVTDVFVTEDAVELVTHSRVDTDATHGSGCTLSAAIATRLAYGDDLEAAVRTAIELLGRAVRYSVDVGKGPGAVHHTVAARNRAEREPTAEAVRKVVRELRAYDVSPLVPEVGMNVVGATPYAEGVGECAAVEGRLGRTIDGVAPTGDVRFGASSHVARFLLAAREFDPDLRFALNCRFDGRVESVFDSLSWPVAEYDRTEQPTSVEATEGSTMQWGARQAYAGRDTPPVAVFDRGARGKEPMTRVVSPDAETLVERVQTLQDAL